MLKHRILINYFCFIFFFLSFSLPILTAEPEDGDIQGSHRVVSAQTQDDPYSFLRDEPAMMTSRGQPNRDNLALSNVTDGDAQNGEDVIVIERRQRIEDHLGRTLIQLRFSPTGKSIFLIVTFGILGAADFTVVDPWLLNVLRNSIPGMNAHIPVDSVGSWLLVAGASAPQFFLAGLTSKTFADRVDRKVTPDAKLLTRTVTSTSLPWYERVAYHPLMNAAQYAIWWSYLGIQAWDNEGRLTEGWAPFVTKSIFTAATFIFVYFWYTYFTCDPLDNPLHTYEDQNLAPLRDELSDAFAMRSLIIKRNANSPNQFNAEAVDLNLAHHAPALAPAGGFRQVPTDNEGDELGLEGENEHREGQESHAQAPSQSLNLNVISFSPLYNRLVKISNHVLDKAKHVPNRIVIWHRRNKKISKAASVVMHALSMPVMFLMTKYVFQEVSILCTASPGLASTIGYVGAGVFSLLQPFVAYKEIPLTTYEFQLWGKGLEAPLMGGRISTITSRTLWMMYLGWPVADHLVRTVLPAVGIDNVPAQALLTTTFIFRVMPGPLKFTDHLLGDFVEWCRAGGIMNFWCFNNVKFCCCGIDMTGSTRQLIETVHRYEELDYQIRHMNAEHAREFFNHLSIRRNLLPIDGDHSEFSSISSRDSEATAVSGEGSGRRSPHDHSGTQTVTDTPQVTVEVVPVKQTEDSGSEDDGNW
ncbi:MAG: hypothetical protein K2Y18_03440 [Alphaproteobacteria bacterium]|jgi:hypothetical protein|nr:hypothetical protein [Alphaproteobacteria bacterium]